MAAGVVVVLGILHGMGIQQMFMGKECMTNPKNACARSYSDNASHHQNLLKQILITLQTTTKQYDYKLPPQIHLTQTGISYKQVVT